MSSVLHIEADAVYDRQPHLRQIGGEARYERLGASGHRLHVIRYRRVMPRYQTSIYVKFKHIFSSPAEGNQAEKRHEIKPP